MLPGGEIDWGHHGGRAHLALSETALFAKAVKKTQELTNKGEYNKQNKKLWILWLGSFSN
jgi:alkaline phosphatase